MTRQVEFLEKECTNQYMTELIIVLNNVMVKKPPLKHGLVVADYSEHSLHSANVKNSSANSDIYSKTITGQHRVAREQKAKANAVPRKSHSTMFGNDFGDHANSNAGFENFPVRKSLGNTISSTGKTLQELTIELKAVQAKQLAHAERKAQANFDNSVQGKIIHGLDNPEPFFEFAAEVVRDITPQGIMNKGAAAFTGYDKLAGRKINKFLAAGETLLPFSGKFFAAGMGVLGRSGKYVPNKLSAVKSHSTEAAFGGELYPPEKLPALVKYLEKRGVSVYGTDANPAFIGRVDGTGQMLLPANPTVLQVKHELSHYLDFRNLGFRKFFDIGRTAREELVLERLQANRSWKNYNEAEKQFSIDYVDRLRNTSTGIPKP